MNVARLLGMKFDLQDRTPTNFYIPWHSVNDVPRPVFSWTRGVKAATFVHALEINGQFYELEAQIFFDESLGEFYYELWVNGQRAVDQGPIKEWEALAKQIRQRGSLF
jgi:hypothetical protein